MINKREILQKIKYDINVCERSKNPKLLEYDLEFDRLAIKCILDDSDIRMRYKLVIPETLCYELIYLEFKEIYSLLAVVFRYLTYLENCEWRGEYLGIIEFITDDDFEEFLDYSYGDFFDLHQYLRYFDYYEAKKYFTSIGEIMGVGRLQYIIEAIKDGVFDEEIYKLCEDDEACDILYHTENTNLYIKNDILLDRTNINHHIDKNMLIQLKERGYNFDIQKTLNYYKEEQIKLLQGIIFYLDLDERYQN